MSPERREDYLRKKRAYHHNHYSEVRRARKGIMRMADYLASVARPKGFLVARRRIYDQLASVIRLLRKYHFILPTRKFKVMPKIQCTITQFKAHIESQFSNGMSWANYGKSGTWEFDHIKSLTSFNLEDPTQLAKAAHFSNVRPLLTKVNVEKSKSERAKKILKPAT